MRKWNQENQASDGASFDYTLKYERDSQDVIKDYQLIGKVCAFFDGNYFEVDLNEHCRYSRELFLLPLEDLMSLYPVVDVAELRAGKAMMKQIITNEVRERSESLSRTA